jgi:ABC-2 type transport system ATP-binding protein
MIKMLTTLLPPTSGAARVAGFDVRQQPGEVRRVIGYVPQMISTDGSLTGYENLIVFAKLYNVPRAEREARAREALDLLGLDAAADKLVRDYSGGMIRRLEIAQSLLHRPRLLFLDEPTIGLDPLARRAVWEQIEALRAGHSTSVLLTTHFMEEAEHLCDRLAIMHRGRVAALGTPAALKSGIGLPDATLDDVFAHFAGDSLESGGSYRETFRTRRKTRRLG